MLSGDDVRRHAVHRRFRSMLPCLVKGHPTNVLQNVDASRRETDLEYRVGIVAEVGWCDSCYRRSKSSKGVIDGLAVPDI